MALVVVHSSDHHHGLATFGVENPLTGLNTRTEDGFSAFDRAVDFAIVNKAQVYIISGDIFDTKSVSQTIVNAFYERVHRLMDAGIFVYILSGNHDNSKRLTRASGLDIAQTLDLPKIHTTRGGDLLDLGYLQIASVSYWNTAEEVAEQVASHASNIDWTRPAALIVHLQIDYPHFPGANKYDLPFVPLEALTAYPFTFVQAGHIHRARVLSQEPFTFYTGSLTRCTAAEENDEKGFWISEIADNKLVSIQHIADDNCLKFLTLRGTMSEIRDKVLPNMDYSNYIVRLMIDTATEPLDNAFIKAEFETAFKCQVVIQSIRAESNKVDHNVNASMEDYLQLYFKDDDDQADLAALVEELKHIDERVLTV